MTNLQTITVDLNPRPDIRDNTIFLKRGDKNSREVVVKLRDNGEPYQLPAGTTVRYAMCKPDKTQVLADVPSYGIVGDTVRFTLSEQCMTVTGKFPAELWLIEDDQVLRTASFQIHVCPSAFSEDLPISSDEYESVSDALVKVDEIWSAYESGELGGGGTAAPENTVSVLQHGAIPDNAAVDNTSAINAAISAAAASGKTIVYFPPGTYWISGTIDATDHDGMTYKGDNATIKLSADVTSFHTMMLANGDDLTIDGLAFDQNVDGRSGIVMPLQNGTSAEVEARRSVCLKIDSTCKNVTVRNCSFTGCGKWLLLFKADGGRIENCKVHFEPPSSPPAAYMDGSYLQYYDVSAIYAAGQNITVTGTMITANSPLLTPQTALELHATACTVRDVTAEGYMSGCIVSGAYVTANEVRDMLIDNCTLRPSTAVGVGDEGTRSQASGISLWGGSSSNDVRAITGLVINNCRIDTPWYGISLYKGNGDIGVNEVSIANTDIRYVGAANTAARDDGLKEIDSAVNFRDYAPCALCLATTGIKADGITMSGCRVYDFPDVAVRANFATSNNNTIVLFDRIAIVDNEFLNCAASNPFVPQRSAVISLDNFSSADVSRNRFIYSLDTPPAPPLRLPICRYTANISRMSYTGNSYYGYPDLSWAYVNNLDYPAGQFIFDTTSVSMSGGVTRVPCGDGFVSDGTAYRAIDGLAITSDTITATVADVPLEGIALLCTGSDAMRIGDKIKVLTRPAYIYNILPTEDETKCILVGQFCGDDTTAATAYPGSAAAGHTVTLVTGVRTEAADNLRANVTPDTAERLPVATATKIGGVMATEKTAEQTLPVGIDASGKLWAAPSIATDSIGYDNAVSGLSATNIKDAIDELAAMVETLMPEIPDALGIISASVSPATCVVDTPVTITATVTSDASRVVAFYTGTSNGIAQSGATLSPGPRGTQNYTSTISFGSVGTKSFTLFARDANNNQSETGIDLTVAVTAS